MTSSPLATRGRYSACCAGVPSIRMPCEPMPMLVPNTERKAGAVRPSSTLTCTSWLTDRPMPPYASGTVSPNRPIAFIASTSAGGTSSCSSR